MLLTLRAEPGAYTPTISHLGVADIIANSFKFLRQEGGILGPVHPHKSANDDSIVAVQDEHLEHWLC